MKDKINLLSDASKSAKELAEIMNVSAITIHRWRKKYGIIVPIGSKKGKLKPENRRREIIRCLFCQKEIERILSEKNKKYCSRKCMYSSDEYINKLRAIDRSYMKTESYSIAKSKSDTPAYRKYSGKVTRLTQKIYEEHKEIINPENKKRTRAGIDGGHQLDHIMSIRYGFDNNIPPEEIAKLENLRVIPWKENLLKGKNNGI